MQQLLLFPDIIPSEKQSPLLTPIEQRELLDILSRGGSPQIACARLNVPPESLSRTLADDHHFRQQLAAVHEIMTHNVVATIYAAALKGTPAAQSLWLKTFPPTANSQRSACDEPHKRNPPTEQQLRQWLALRPADGIPTPIKH